MKIVSTHIYPIKSLQGISLPSAKLLERGIEFDRRWMLVDENDLFVTQRTLSALALYSVGLLNDSLQVTSPNGDIIYIPFKPTGSKHLVSVWDDKVEAIEVSTQISNWFSSQLNKKVKLVYMPDNSTRLIDSNYASNNESVSFADAYPLLIVNTASFENLNLKLKNKITIDRFRANIVVEGSTPFEEDEWHQAAMGSSKVEIVKKCARCVMVNIDPATATKETEVLSILSEYRKKDNKVFFGVNALVLKIGIFNVGDELLLD